MPDDTRKSAELDFVNGLLRGTHAAEATQRLKKALALLRDCLYRMTDLPKVHTDAGALGLTSRRARSAVGLVLGTTNTELEGSGA